MKKMLLIISIICVLFLIGCKTNKNVQEINNNQLKKI